ncbi:MAG: UvrD-helicase domain-containing protein, partial [Melioribacteraceae bacterium]|nr:UvrD-helicase domain-containing protein [Melioribacteraceae bacterium]
MANLTEYQKAALAYNKHISLTANAGSGKTTVLAKRFVEILINEKISINNIVAITFTEKAAIELYSKIANELDQRIIHSEAANNFKLEAIRRSLVSANISTIHSFCIDILKDYAPEVGIDANFSPIDSRTSEELLDQSIDEIITTNLISESTNVKSLIRIFSSKSQLVSKTKHLFNKRKTTEQLVNNFYNKNTDEISDYFSELFHRKFIDLFEENVNRLIINVEIINSIAGNIKTNDKQIEINRILNEIKPQNSVIDKFILLVELSKILLTQKGEVVKKGYLPTKLYEENITRIEEINNLFNELASIEINENYEKLNLYLASFGKNIAGFYKEINEKYTYKKLQKSYLDFEDLLLLTQKLLANSEIQNALSEKYKYIMIDEYQDTNETQYNIFMPILKNLTTGNLFVVGDEKQSIYMFREAEVALFYQTQKEVQEMDAPGSLLELPHSFRLAPNIAMFTNVLFRRLFENPNSEFNEVDYSDLVCAYPHQEKGKVELLIAKEDEISEAELVTRKILKIIDDPNNEYSFGDIAILCTKRKNFLELEQTFSEYRIPFNIVGGKGFFQQQIILDIYNYISFLINPQNDLALATILRAPYYGLSDVELTKIALKRGKSLFDKIKNEAKYNTIVLMLMDHMHSAKILQTNELIRKINNDTGYWTYLASKQNGKQEIANLKKLIQKAISINEQGFHTLYDFVVYLKDAINNLDDEGQAELDVGENSIKIMTIHQAKGLEFNVVIIFKTNQKSFDESLKSKDIIVDKNFGILSKLPIENNYFEPYQQAPIIGIYNYIQKKKSNAELKRLLYVAITRAEQHLIISAAI